MVADVVRNAAPASGVVEQPFGDQQGESARLVVHEIESGWFLTWVGQQQVRSFRFDRDWLILETDSPAWHVPLIGKR